MNVTHEQSVTIYARASRKWFGAMARERTRERIAQLASAGDTQGAKVLEQVHQHILKLERDNAIGDVAHRVA